METLLVKLTEQLFTRLIAPPIPLSANQEQTMMLYKVFLMMFFVAMCCIWILSLLRSYGIRLSQLEKQKGEATQEEVEDYAALKLKTAKNTAVLSRIEEGKYAGYLFDPDIDRRDVPK